jgi:hypothetical protein
MIDLAQVCTDARAASAHARTGRLPIHLDRPVSEPENGCSSNPQKRPSPPAGHIQSVT